MKTWDNMIRKEQEQEVNRWWNKLSFNKKCGVYWGSEN